MEKKLRVGILGCGNQGTAHIKWIKADCPDFEITAVCDINPARIDWCRENLPDTVRYFTDASEMIRSGVMDCCIISVPHYDHPRYAIECMERGIHVMCEKPAGVYTRQVREMNAVAEQHPEVKFGMMFNQRTNNVYRKMREIVQSGTYGEIRRVNWLITNWYRPQAYYDSGAWRATWAGEGGGVLLNQCPHNLDLWQWICGMPVKVSTHMHFGKWHDIEVEDDVTTYVEYANGATGTFITTTGDGCGTNRLEIQLDRGKLIAENDVLTVIEFEMAESEFTKVNKIPFGSIKTHKVDVELPPQGRQHIDVLNAWADAILRDGDMIAHGSEGINGLTISNAMHLSAFLGRDVELPFDEDLFYDELMKRVATSRHKAASPAVFADTEGTFTGTK